MRISPSLRGTKRSNPSRGHSGRLDGRVALLLAMTMTVTSCLTPTGTQAPAALVSYGQSGAGSAGIHTVFEGDTVYRVSQRYRLPLREIIALNDLSPPYTLEIGDRLRLPPPNEYKVQAGDTLNGISRLFEISVSETARLNDIPAPYTIQKGQVIRLPSKQPKLQEEFAQNPAPPSFASDMDAGEKTSVPVQVGSVESEVLPPVGGADSGVKTAATPPQPTAKAADGAASKTAAAPPEKVEAPKAQVVQKIPARAGTGKFMRPLDGKIISKYGPKDGGLHNDGINIRAARGTAVRSAENGVVAYTGNELQGYGNLVLIRHQDRWMTAYAHMDKMLVKKGDTVKAGQSIGTVGATGQVDSPQLHFEIRRGTQAVNPELYL